MAKPVKKLAEVVTNVKRFNRDLKRDADLQSQLRQFRHWYFIPHLNQFGPSKFIGYQNMSAALYERGKGKSGEETEKVLKKWSVVVRKNSGPDQRLFDLLRAMHRKYRKAPNKDATIHVPATPI